MPLNQLLLGRVVCVKLKLVGVGMFSLTMAYNFDRIFNLSKTKELKKLIEEWHFFGKERREDGLCICGHHMKYVAYFLNILTGHVIQVGETCRKKLRLTLEGRKLNPILRELIEGSQLGYTNIFDLLRYSEESRIRLIQLVKGRITNSSDLATLQILLKELIDLLELHTQNTITCDYINELIEKVKVNIKGIEKREKEQREQREQREKEQREKREKEQSEQKERWEKEVREQREKWEKWEKEERENREQREKEQREKEIEKKERRIKWLIEKKEMEKRFMIEKEVREREESLEKKEIIKEISIYKETESEIKKKKREEFWNKFAKPSNLCPSEP